MTWVIWRTPHHQIASRGAFQNHQSHLLPTYDVPPQPHALASRLFAVLEVNAAPRARFLPPQILQPRSALSATQATFSTSINRLQPQTLNRSHIRPPPPSTQRQYQRSSTGQQSRLQQSPRPRPRTQRTPPSRTTKRPSANHSSKPRLPCRTTTSQTLQPGDPSTPSSRSSSIHRSTPGTRAMI